MHSPSTRPLFFFLLLLGALLLICFPARAQNELVPNPAAVKLRRVWTHEGKDGVEYEYGYAVSGVPDISGDSINDFAVYRNSDNTWLFYKGGDPPDSLPFWSMDSVGRIPPYVVRFRGDDRRYMLFIDGYMEIIDDFSYFYDRVRLFEVDEDGVRSEAAMEVDEGKKDPPIERFLKNIVVQDANNDSIEDMIVLSDGVRIGRERPAKLARQVWFYIGGKDFRLEEPTVVVQDTSRYGTPDNWEVYFADFDGDGKLDMVMGGSYPTGGPMLRFYWGDENSPWSWATRPPDRDLQLKQGETPLITRLSSISYLEDYDGDGAADLSGDAGEGTYIYLSSRGNARTRSFLLPDADLYYHSERLGFSIGPLNDSAGRYDMLSLGTRYVSGSSYGPDHDYDAFFRPADEGLSLGNAFGRGGPVGDVTGDGWPDYGAGNESYGLFVHTGIALILAGGPYIPFDDTTLTVQDVPVAGDAGGLYLWPNPVKDELNIAWKGNLKSMPARFALYDIDGRQVVEGEIQPQLGAALWRCASVAAGTYVLVAFDAEGKRIASATVVKQ